ADLIGAQAPRHSGNDPRTFNGVAGVSGHNLHSYKEAVEAAEAGDPGTDRHGRRLLARAAGAVGPSEDFRSCDVVWRMSYPAKEMVEHSAIADDGPHGAGASLFLGEEGVEAAFPASRGLIQVGDGVHGDPFHN